MNNNNKPPRSMVLIETRLRGGARKRTQTGDELQRPRETWGMGLAGRSPNHT